MEFLMFIAAAVYLLILWLALITLMVPAAALVFWIIVLDTALKLRKIPPGDVERRIPLERSLRRHRIAAIVFSVVSVVSAIWTAVKGG